MGSIINIAVAWQLGREQLNTLRPEMSYALTPSEETLVQ
jgi:hypothetical protein